MESTAQESPIRHQKDHWHRVSSGKVLLTCYLFFIHVLLLYHISPGSLILSNWLPRPFRTASSVSLDQTEHTNQMKRYLDSLANLILTDYLEFRWYVAGQHRVTARLAKIGVNNKLLPEPVGLEKVADLLQGFMVTQVPTVSNPKERATRMAALAQLIRSAIHLSFETEEG